MVATQALVPARQKAVDLITATCADQALRHLDDYEAVRPQNVRIVWKPGVKLRLDCSDYCRFICISSDIPDPAGNNGAPYGNSSSIWAHCHHIDLADAQPGDIVTFGFRYGERHAAILHSLVKGQWRVGNFGGQGQPIIDWLAQEIAYHRGMTWTVCRVEAAPIPITAADNLRAATDFFSWMSWTYGWNAWRHYGARNPHVRPNVGAVIAVSHPTWWGRRAQFLLNRKRADKATRP